MPQTARGEPAFAVVGHGSWATALVKILLENGNVVRWFVRNPEVRAHIEQYHSNPKYLSQVHFYSERLHVSGDLAQVVSGAEVVVFATPSAFLEATVRELTPADLAGKFLVSAIKGIIPDGYQTVVEWLGRRFVAPIEQIGVVTGPCHAEEVALERLSYLTMVCHSLQTAQALGERFRSDYIRTTVSTDIHGVEYAVVLKNIYAIAVGMAHGLGYGDNFLAVLISNAALEMERFLEAICRGAEQKDSGGRNLFRSVYLGDLLVTCYSQFSRNRTFGMMIGKGYSVQSAQMEMNMVAEGYYGAECIHRLADGLGIGMPIAEAVYGALYARRRPAEQLQAILGELE